MNAGPPEPNQVDAPRAVSVKDLARGRELSSASPAERAASKVTEAPGLRRLIFVCLYRIAPRILDAVAIIEPETVIRWHRAGFRAFWRWKSRSCAGRPRVPPEIRRLIREMSLANPLWGAPRIHAELLKLGIDVGQTSVGKYMARRRRPPSQGWRTFSYSPEQKQLLRPREPLYCGNDMHEFLQSRGPATGI